MKNQIKTFRYEGQAEMKAKKAIRLIHKWVEERYPKLAAESKSRLIAQCLTEVEQERKIIGMQ